MSFYRSKVFWIATAIFLPLLLVASYYGFKVMMSVYKTDLGNGVVIYADDYVKTGRWVFDCEYSRLVSREPLPVPFSELENAGKLTIGNALLEEADEQPAKEALKAITGTRGWYKNLRYLYSALDENSDLNAHAFYLVAQHAGRSWAVEVDQAIGLGGKSEFTVTIEPYDPDIYVDYAKALQAAAKSCTAAQ
ncbi:hypothetical protein Q6A51_16565 [Pseudomonas sp. KFB-139]|uniref:Uncharacterized protein n=1 Tax=Pseudomonas serbiensis TaxID=3064350 RepID=A0ABT9CXA6_9PSED|nr:MULTISPECIES: hypothetical protein [Pseudomonas]MDO7928402.1 hypothetical protein [Pseudomonas sp. KFB-138]